jgi:hypothetical protein
VVTARIDFRTAGIAGGIFALPTAFILMASSDAGWIRFLLIAVFVAAVVGIPQGWLTYRYIHGPRAPGHFAQLLFALVFVDIITVTGVLLLLSRVPLGRWQRLPDPPEPALALLGPTCTDDEATAYIQSTGGRFFRYIGYRPRSTWSGVDSVPAGVPPTILPCSEPAAVPHRLHVSIQGADCGGWAEYEIRHTGIWARGDEGCALAAVFGWIAGCLLTVGTSAGIWTRIGIATRSREPSTA